MKGVYISTVRVLLIVLMAIFTAVLVLLVKRAHSGVTSPIIKERIIEDIYGRQVSIPEEVDSIVCLKASAIRLVCYAGGADRICGVEECELRGAPYTHLFANPELRGLKSVGPMMGGDAELTIIADPDLIFLTCSTPEEADFIQRRCRVPVLCLDYGDLWRERAKFDTSLRIIGEALGTQLRVDSLITYIDSQISELERRVVETNSLKESRGIYVCGISYKGTKGATSTDPYYAALQFLHTPNIASGVDPSIVSAVNGTIVNLEQVALWNPDVIFVDHDGLNMVMDDLRRIRLDSAELHTIWPYNNVHSNFEVMLINSWYMGKVLYPDRFKDISIDEKRNEVLDAFLHAPVGDSLVAAWGELSKI
ncbi:MAG: ABC transporter substrate-binding protein [Marinifilaceae bacterium]|nr:ABC transporter substrate-binding protein [Marinifilaceae bacterium]